MVKLNIDRQPAQFVCMNMADEPLHAPIETYSIMTRRRDDRKQVDVSDGQA
jgi:hypothetical protein